MAGRSTAVSMCAAMPPDQLMRRSSTTTASASSVVAKEAPASAAIVDVSTVARVRAGTATYCRVVRPVVSTNVSSTWATFACGLAMAKRVEKKPLLTPSARYRFRVPRGCEPAACSAALVRPSPSGSPAAPLTPAAEFGSRP